ncbi:type I pullulanase [Terrimonas alba]|uniref:type I pullulanase n=1 Tax=Terrimonas alba TaxID=3349636 RepID=UPI0035F29286
MNKVLMLIGLLIPFITKSQSVKFDNYPVYIDTDLGQQYTPQQSFFRVWSPTAAEVELRLYKEGIGGEAIQTISMKKSRSGTWTASLKGDQQGKFYAFRVKIKGEWSQEVPDPYAKAVGVNGRRGMITDLKLTNPAGWEKDKGIPLKNATDAIIYELHIRDASIATNSGIKNKGKFLGLTEKGTVNNDGLSTGLDHIKDLGVTHVHILPLYDFYSVDETKLDKPQYNWGYDPLNYNTTEGSYSTNPYDGLSRIREFKEMVKTFHANGLNIVMDVVYNHTMLTGDSYFNQLVPGYYYRQTPQGKFSNATACGNETASERPMVRKFMLESLKYWVKEYHIDGFRFDLMGVHDIETMNIIAKELRKIKPDILLYGEGWTAGASPLAETKRAVKKYAYRLDNIAVFSDDIRDGIKGSVFVNDEKGFTSGRPGMEESIKFGVVASTKHPQVDYRKVNYSKASYAVNPSSTVTYAECHDNHVLWDKLALSAPTATEAERKEMHKLALSIVLTSQGISFLHAGTEFLRSKKGSENSFDAGDSINAVDWSLKTKNKDVFEYVKALIQLRKEHPAFRMQTGKQVADNIRFLKTGDGIVAYTINGRLIKDKWNKIVMIYNGNAHKVEINLPAGEWEKYSLPGQELSSHQVKNSVIAEARSCTIFYQ